MKPAILRPRAKSDLSDQAAYYAERVGKQLGEEFLVEALEARALLQRQPGLGSLRWAPPGLTPPLRSWRVGRFPSIWFYFEREDHLDLVRLLGERQDIAAILTADLG